MRTISNFLTKMCLTRNRELAFSMSEAARKAGARVLVNSSDATDHIGEYLDHGADFVMMGEVENTLLETVRALLGRSTQKTTSIEGLAYRDRVSGSVSRNAPRELIGDLDSLPLPAWDLIDAGSYRDAWKLAHGYFSLNMVSSRGCPYRCNWCSKPIYGSSYHVRSARRVAEEMLLLKQMFRPDQIWFADDIFALSAEWTVEFADGVVGLDARIPFKMQSRCDLMTRPTVASLRRAGCAEVWMGAESGSQRVLDAMEKSMRVERAAEACAHLREHGIRTGLFLQFGYPGEKWEDIQSTIRMVREAKPDDIGVSVSYPLPRTKFYNLVESQLGAQEKLGGFR